MFDPAVTTPLLRPASWRGDVRRVSTVRALSLLARTKRTHEEVAGASLRGWGVCTKDNNVLVRLP